MSNELYFEKAPTGRTHQVNNGGVIQNQPILGADGEPEQEYVLGALVDGVQVPLQTFPIGYVEHLLTRDQSKIGQAQLSSQTAAEPAQPAQPTASSPPEGEGTAGEGAAAQPAPPDQQTS